ncbi:MAG: 4Fe-4S binding protein [Firmicutes bacterium]|nr:4Fe-4S binding protein [Bacillota bacterium]
MMAKSMGKSFSISDACIGCGKCEMNCPKHNINYKGKITATSACFALAAFTVTRSMSSAIKKQIEQCRVYYDLEIDGLI